MRLLIQAGHVAPREPGFESGTGTTREQDLVSAVQSRLGKLLAKDGRFDVTLCPGDIPNGWTGDVFLSLHGDGSASPASSGFCYGYPTSTPNSRAFAQLLKTEYEKLPGHPPHRKDNYTRDLAGYYGFRRVNAPVRVLVEHGFLTNPAEREWLFDNVQRIAEAHYRAVCRHFNKRPVALAPVKPKKPPVLVDVFVDGKQVNNDQRVDNPKLWARVRSLAARFRRVEIRRGA